jgi:hypothetical protein
MEVRAKMAPGDVKSSQQAVQAAQHIQTIINNDLQGAIAKLNQQAATLSDPNVFEGPLAQKFRNQVWPEAQKTLNQIKTDLERLRGEVQNITQEIMRAGGA